MGQLNVFSGKRSIHWSGAMLALTMLTITWLAFGAQVQAAESHAASQGLAVQRPAALPPAFAPNIARWEAREPFPVGMKDTLLITQAGSAFWTGIQDAAVVGNYAYCAAYYGLLVLNVSNPANPAVVSQLYFPGWSVYHPILGGIPERDIEVEGDYAYMTSPCEGMKIIDISDPVRPVLVGSYDIADSCEALWEIIPTGGFLYAASYQGLEILDVSTLSNPHRVAGLPAAFRYMSTLAIKGSTLYLGGVEGLEVVNIADPLNPSMVATYDIHCLNISVRNNWAYLDGENGQLIVADISNPASPQFVDTVDCSGTLGTACVYGSYLYIGIDSLGGSSFASRFNTLGIFSLANPASPSQVGKLALPSSGLINITVTGTRAYLSGWNGIAIVNVANPAAPSLLGTYGPQVGSNIAVSGNLAYFPGRDTLYILDVANPSRPTISGRCTLGPPITDWRIAVAGGYAYLYGHGAGMRIINVLHPQLPFVEGQYACDFLEIAVRDTLVYGVGGDSLRIISVVDPAHPVQVGQYQLNNAWSFLGIVVQNDQAYIAINNNMESKNGLLVVDISDPTAPDSLGSYYDYPVDPIDGGDIEIRDTCAYVWGCPNVINISDPLDPVAMPGSPMPNIDTWSLNSVHLALSGNLMLVVLTGWDPRYWVMDISDPAHPSPALEQKTIGFPTDVAASGGYAYVPERVGLSILRLAQYSVGSGYFVTSLADAGIGSLRSAIDSANAHPGPDTLLFLISGVIQLTLPLPALVDDSTVILGSTALGGNWSVILDGAAISGGGDGLVVQSQDNVIDGLTIRNFPGNGITVGGALSIRNRLTKNLIYNNNGLGIDLGADGVTANDIGDVDTGPNDLLNYPEIDSVFMNPDSSFRVYGRAADSAIIEFFVAHPVGDAAKPADPSGHGEAYAYVGSDTAGTGGGFIFAIAKSVGQFSVISATDTDSLGSTSEFSYNFSLTPAPLIVVAYSPVNIILTDPNGLRFGKDSLGSDITDIPDGHYFITPNDSVVIDHPIAGTYIVQFVTEVGIPVGATYSAIIQIDGTQQLIIAADKLCPASGKVDTSTYMVEEGFHYKNGDGNRDNTINIGDAVFVVNYVFKGGPAPDPKLAGDANCDRVVNIGDAVYVINYIFKGGPAPCAFTH